MRLEEKRAWAVPGRRSGLQRRCAWRSWLPLRGQRCRLGRLLLSSRLNINSSSWIIMTGKATISQDRRPQKMLGGLSS